MFRRIYEISCTESCKNVKPQRNAFVERRRAAFERHDQQEYKRTVATMMQMEEQSTQMQLIAILQKLGATPQMYQATMGTFF